MGMFGRFRPRGGDSATMARGDSSRLVPSAGGMGRPPGPPPRGVGAASAGKYPGPPPRDESGDRGYGGLPQRPGRGAKDPGSLPKRPSPNQTAMTSNPAPAMQAVPWNESPASKPKPKPKYDPSTDKRPYKQLSPDEQAARGQWAKESSYNPKVNYQPLEEWASSVARRNGWIPD